MATNLLSNKEIEQASRKLRIRDLEHQLQVEIEALEPVRPTEPEEANAVIRFNKYGSAYGFAAIRINSGATARWYLTQDGSRSSRQGHAPKVWGDLLSWIGERNWDKIEVLS